MNTTSTNPTSLIQSSRRIARMIMTMTGNRVELLKVEALEEWERLRIILLLVLGMVVCGLLAVIACTAILVVLLWQFSPWAVLTAVTLFYALASVIFYRRLQRCLRDHQPFSATLEQLRKDRTCVANIIS
jgi:uncharacterized membrane protein YqjE